MARSLNRQITKKIFKMSNKHLKGLDFIILAMQIKPHCNHSNG